MSNIIPAAKGTQVILPAEVSRWQRLEDLAREVSELYGYREIRFPMFEHTELFQRGIGEETEVVEKEMYTFPDRSGRSLTLRPEGTASVARAFVEMKMQPGAFWKVYYLGPMFRYERPQGGRFRQFHQYGIEAIGSADPALDAEVILLAMEFYRRLGLEGLIAEINSLGCPACRPRYREILRTYLESRIGEVCPECQRRFERNILRILDCKKEACRQVVSGAPEIFPFLCEGCLEHFEEVKKNLELMNHPYRVNPLIVRGLDYYTRTVFEVLSENLGAQNTLCGGGRYDGLIEEVGGGPTPAVGFASGIERALMVLAAQKGALGESSGVLAFLVPIGEEARVEAQKLLYRLREGGIAADRDYSQKGLKAQMKAADRAGAAYALIIGEDELAARTVTLKRLATGEQETVGMDRVLEVLGKKSGLQIQAV